MLRHSNSQPGTSIFYATDFILNKYSRLRTGSSWHILASGNSGFIWTASTERYSRRDEGNDLLNCVKNEFVWSYCRLLGKYPELVLIPFVRPSAKFKYFEFSGTYLNSPTSFFCLILVQRSTSPCIVSTETESCDGYQYCPFWSTWLPECWACVGSNSPYENLFIYKEYIYICLWRQQNSKETLAILHVKSFRQHLVQNLFSLDFSILQSCCLLSPSVLFWFSGKYWAPQKNSQRTFSFVRASICLYYGRWHSPEFEEKASIVSVN